VGCLSYGLRVNPLDPRLEALIDRLPKAELHVHLEGSIPPELALRLAHRHGRELPGMAAGAEGLRQHYRFADFSEFLRMYLAISACLVEAADFCEITVALARSLAAQRVVYAEVTFTAMTHVARGVDPAAMLDGLAEGRARARSEFGVELAWVFDIVRVQLDRAEPTLALALRGQADGVIGLGFAGPESAAYPIEPFAPIFARARAAGLHSLPHAGEMAGPQSIRDALNFLGAERIGHGVRAVDDPALLEHLVARQIPLEVCPTSNLGIGLYPSLQAHPLPRLLAAGVAVSLASDDPPMFATSLVDEYRRCASAYAWDAAQVRALAAASVEHSFLPEVRKQALRAEQRQVSDDLESAVSQDR
jgi:aminodeoxyfutalosine deaminase